MKNIFVPILLLSSVQFVTAQETEVNDSLPTKTITRIDSIVVQDHSKDISETQVLVSKKDTIVYALEDLENARKQDSLWQEHIYSAPMFEEVYGTLSTQENEPVAYEELPTEVLKHRLEELNKRTPFNVTYNPSLERVIKHYLKNRRESLTRLMALSSYYFPMFEETLDKHDLPLELKYLAIVESALDPRAKSRVGAKGLWQFMFSTGKMYGLDVNSYVDERADPQFATEAASKYLNALHKSLGDWDLALAAYNSGPGNVSKAIRRSGGKTNYWNIRHHLPRETAGYVPAFLATMYIFEYAEEHGFPKNGPQFHYVATDTIQVKKQITLEQVSKITEVPLDELTYLNPSYKHQIIPVVKNKNYVLRLPIYAMGKFVTHEDAIYAFAEAEISKREKPLPEFYEQPDKIRYRVKSGDYLGKIAEKYGVGVSQIKRWNGLKNSKLRVGQRLTIYPRNPVSSSNKKAIAKSQPSNSKTYTVKNGDSLWSISQKFPGVTVKQLKKWNDISGTTLKPGMKLKVQKG